MDNNEQDPNSKPTPEPTPESTSTHNPTQPNPKTPPKKLKGFIGFIEAIESEFASIMDTPVTLPDFATVSKGPCHYLPKIREDDLTQFNIKDLNLTDHLSNLKLYQLPEGWKIIQSTKSDHRFREIINEKGIRIFTAFVKTTEYATIMKCVT